MTICHTKELDGEFTDEQLIEHLISSDCSECRDAGFRLKMLVSMAKTALTYSSQMPPELYKALYPDL